MGGFVYILASGRNGTLYVGVTADLAARVHQHRERLTPGFTSRHGVARLVHYERYEDIREAIQREKTLKHRLRSWKIALIERDNPQWLDLYEQLNL
nr:GIY-YIG nuclease family protein [Rhodoligotrophos appendicifer]